MSSNVGDKLFENIVHTVKRIDEELMIANKTGIYFAPELYVAFCLGSEISKNKVEIFGHENIEWLREINLGNGGPSDIVLRSSEQSTVIELKLRDTYASYKADIEKLKRLRGKYQKYFCVLVDSFNAQNDDRLAKIENEYLNQIQKVGHYSYPTWNGWYQQQVYCNLNLYEII